MTFNRRSEDEDVHSEEETKVRERRSLFMLRQPDDVVIFGGKRADDQLDDKQVEQRMQDIDTRTFLWSTVTHHTGIGSWMAG